MPFKSMKQERKALLGVAVALALIVLGLASWSDAPDPYAKFDSGSARGLEPEPEQPPPPLPPDEDEDNDDEPEDQSDEKSRGGDEKTPQEAAVAPKTYPPGESPTTKSGGGAKQKDPAPAKQKRRARPVVQAPTPTTRSKPERRSPRRTARRPPRTQPVPTVTSASVRALRSRASSQAVVSALGQPLSIARMNGLFGQQPVSALLSQEPADTPCSYYRLAPGEPAPLVRICFDANDRLASRDFVAPPS